MLAWVSLTKTWWAWSLIQGKRRGKFLDLRIMEPQVSSICLLKFNFQMSLTVLNSHSEGWSLKSLCASVWKVSDTVLFCWTRLREKVAGFGVLKTFLQLLLWEAVVPSCVATRAQYSVHFNSRRGFAALWKFIQNSTQSTGFWEIPAHRHTEDAAQLQWGHWGTQPESRDRCPFQWLKLEHSKQVLAHLLPYLRCRGWLSEHSSSVTVKIQGSGAIHWQWHLNSPQLLIPSLYPPLALVKLFMGPTTWILPCHTPKKDLTILSLNWLSHPVQCRDDCG